MKLIQGLLLMALWANLCGLLIPHNWLGQLIDIFERLGLM